MRPAPPTGAVDTPSAMSTPSIPSPTKPTRRSSRYSPGLPSSPCGEAFSSREGVSVILPRSFSCDFRRLRFSRSLFFRRSCRESFTREVFLSLSAVILGPPERSYARCRGNIVLCQQHAQSSSKGTARENGHLDRLGRPNVLAHKGAL